MNELLTPVQLGKPAYVTSYQLGLDTGLFNSKTKEVHILNAVAASIFNQIISGRKIPEIADSINVCFSQDGTHIKEIEKDIESMVSYFKVKGLVEQVRSSKKQKVAIVTEFSMNQLPMPYFRPAVQTYTQNQLNEVNNHFKDRAVFLDTWTVPSMPSEINTKKK